MINRQCHSCQCLFCANRLGENMHTGGRIRARLTCLTVVGTKGLCTPHSVFVSVLVIREIHALIVVSYEAIEKSPHNCAPVHSGLIPEVEQEPQFKCGIGNRQLDRIVSRHLDRVRNSWMVIDIENHPYRIVLEIVVFLLCCFRFSRFLAVTRNRNHSQRNAGVRGYFQRDSRILARICKAPKVLRLS